MINISKQCSLFFGDNEVVVLRLTNSCGAFVELLNLGAGIVSINIADKYGEVNNIVLGYDNIGDYLDDKFYLGATIGRYANRVARGGFVFENNYYSLDKNDGDNSNHGGFSGFNKKIFDYRITPSGVVFSLLSGDGEGGFPGNLTLSVVYSFSDDNILRIEYHSISDKSTPINFTNHTYFNLAAKNLAAIDAVLSIDAGEYLESNDEFLPTGVIKQVAGSMFDFRRPQIISRMMQSKCDYIRGYNTFYIQKAEHRMKSPLAVLKDDKSGRRMELYTTMPGVMLYTGDYLSSPFLPFGGVCLEAHYHPDGLNHPNFETCVLAPYQEMVDVIEYRFKY